MIHLCRLAATRSGAFAGVMIGALLAVAMSGEAPAVRAIQPDQPAQKLTPLYFGVSLCRKCHNEKEAVPDKQALLYRGTEMQTWDKLDKHKDAMRVLQGERSGQMAKILGWNVAADRRCVSCHGVVVADEKQIDEDSFGPEQRLESGVSCVVCHGAYKEWVNNHAAIIGGATWKKLTRAEKERNHGLRDLWDPAKRAALCCSCHVGNVAEGKVVTHEMYAAGHPPLPGIEVATFGDAMPRHWETLTEKVAKRPQHKEFHQRVHSFDADDNEQARLLAVSALVAFRTSVQLMHDLAAEEVKQPNAKEPRWPELAVFDCHACHHDLKSDSWRLLRATAGRPGRPKARPWPATLGVVINRVVARRGDATTMARHAEFTVAFQALAAPFDKVPFGDSRSVIENSAELLQASERVERAAQAIRYDRATTLEILMSMLQRSEKDWLDFDSARQLAWGVRILLPSLEPDWATRPALKQPLDLLHAQLQLDLPRGQVRIAEEYLPQVLKSISAYDPRAFQKAMRAVAAEMQSR